MTVLYKASHDCVERSCVYHFTTKKLNILWQNRPENIATINKQNIAKIIESPRMFGNFVIIK